MTIKEEILERSGILYEMAAKHLVPVIKLIKDGEIENAVEKYREAGGVPGGVTRTVNHYLKNNPDVDKENFDKFMAAFSKIRAAEGKDKPTRSYTTSKTGKTKEGKTVEAGGQSAISRNKRIIERAIKELKKSQKESDTLKKGSTTDLKVLAKAMISDISDGKLTPEEKADVEALKDFVGGEENDEEAKEVMRQVIERGKINIAALGDVSAQYQKLKPSSPEKEKEASDKYKKIESAKKAKGIK